MSIPWFTIPPLDLEFIGLGRIPFFSITSAASVGTVLVAFEIVTRRSPDLDAHLARKMILISVIGAYLGSYWAQLFFYRPDWLAADAWVWLKIWRGGFSSAGGYVGCILAAWLYLRLQKTLPVPYLDRLLVAYTTGWAVARLGCAVIHDHPGVLTDFFLGLQFPDGVRHDLGLYEFLFVSLIQVPAVYAVCRRPWRSGSLAAAVNLIYSIPRFFLDFLRVGDARYLGLTPAQYGMIFLFVLGIVFARHAMRDGPSLQPPLWGPLRRK